MKGTTEQVLKSLQTDSQFEPMLDELEESE